MARVLAVGGLRAAPAMSRASPSGAPPTLYRGDLDGLRAVAVALVLLFHFDLLPAGNAGFIGVDVFFVISGYLITSIIQRRLDDDSFGVREFYLSRIRRLAPALLATMLLTLAAGALWLFPSDFVELATQAALAQTYLVNFYYWRHIDYFGLNAENVYLLHTWSLAVEEQFYILYPLSLALASRVWRRGVPLVLAVALLLSFALNVAFVATKPQATFYLLPTRAWELLAGALIPTLCGALPRGAAVRELLAWCGAGLLAGGALLFDPGHRFPGYFALLPVTAAVCLIVSGTGGYSTVSRALGIAPMAYLGRLSYPLYLVHWPANVFAAVLLGGAYGLQQRLATLALSIVLAAAIYHAVELPVRRRKRLRSDRRLAWAYAAGVAATAAAFVLARATDGFPGRFRDEVLLLASYADDKSPDLVKCRFAGEPLRRRSDFCRIGARDVDPQWLVYGDSHAWAAYGAFDRWLQRNGQAGLFIFRHSCPPLVGVHILWDHGICHAFNDAVYAFLRSDDGISKVFLVSTWRQAIERRITSSPEIGLGREDSARLFRSSFRTTVESAAAMRKDIYVWEPLPGARDSVPQRLARAALDGGSPDIEIGREEYVRTYDFFFRAIKENRPAIAGSFSPAAEICGSGRCAVAAGGVPLYFDNSHVSRSSSDFWARALDRQLSAPRAGATGRRSAGAAFDGNE